MDQRKPLPQRYNPSGFLAGLFFAGFASFLVILSFLPHRFYLLWVQESGPVEKTTATLLLLGAYFAATSFFQRLKIYGQFHPFVFLCAFLFFFVGMEEISWGQRLFGIAPLLAGDMLNYQGEFTLHNLHHLGSFIYFGGFAFIFLWAGILPLLTHFSKSLKKICLRMGVPLMPWLIFVFMWIGFVTLVFVPSLSFGIQNVFNRPMGEGAYGGTIYELRELYFTLMIFSYFFIDYFYLLKFGHAYDWQDVGRV